jgi:hypothetical protein
VGCVGGDEVFDGLVDGDGLAGQKGADAANGFD